MQRNIARRDLLKRLSVMLCGVGVALGLAYAVQAGEKAPQDAGARQAAFEVRHELTVKVPEGAEHVRVWFVLPQDDPIPGDGGAAAQQVKDLHIDAPYPYRVERDSEGSKVLYLETRKPQEKEIKVVETFVLTRAEVRLPVDPAKAKPLTEADRQRYAAYLAPNKHVEIDAEVRRVADEIVGDEQNPVLAARKIYDWVLHNVDY
jgi:hypothetical protein